MVDMNATPQFMREQVNVNTAPYTLCGTTPRALCRSSSVLSFYNATHTGGV